MFAVPPDMTLPEMIEVVAFLSARVHQSVQQQRGPAGPVLVTPRGNVRLGTGGASES